MSTKILETAFDFYSELKKRGLHLRKDYGRDNELFNRLTKNLGCPDDKLHEFLKKSDLSSETFLIEFLKIAQPFSKMFEEIWEYLAEKAAPKAGETISIRFGFPDEHEQTSIDLDTFRRYVDTSSFIFEKIRVPVWSYDALGTLFEISQEAEKFRNLGDTEYKRYRPGQPHQLPVVHKDGHPFDDIVHQLRNMFQTIIDDYKDSEEKRKINTRGIQELEDQPEDNNYITLRRYAFLLTDLLPRWHRIFALNREISSEWKNQSHAYYKKNIEPMLRLEENERKLPIMQAMDILDMPFWKDRWHTYEIWSTVITLKALTQYQPSPRIIRGRIAFDSFNTEIVADLIADKYDKACLAIQVQTPYTAAPPRKAIKPDLRICFSDDITNIHQTAAIVEFKQRESATTKHIEEISRSYTGGAPASGGTIIINYDEPEISPNLDSKSFILQGLHPGNPTNIKLYDDTLIRLLKSVKLVPLRFIRVLLLDVSLSMEGTYGDSDIQYALREVLRNKLVKVFRFNNGLLSGGDWLVSDIQASGSTQLGAALDQLSEEFDQIDQLLIVTDGGHDNPDFSRWKIKQVKQCLPVELPLNVAWLK